MGWLAFAGQLFSSALAKFYFCEYNICANPIRYRGYYYDDDTGLKALLDKTFISNADIYCPHYLL
jgi:hypothetical protein